MVLFSTSEIVYRYLKPSFNNYLQYCKLSYYYTWMNNSFMCSEGECAEWPLESDNDTLDTCNTRDFFSTSALQKKHLNLLNFVTSSSVLAHI